MKYCLEFGTRGGFHVDNVVISSYETARKLAAGMVGTLSNSSDMSGASACEWQFPRGASRICWRTRTHFVALSKMDGKDRGAAAAYLWRKPSGGELLNDSVWIDSGEIL